MRNKIALAIVVVCSLILNACANRECGYRVDAPGFQSRRMISKGLPISNLPTLAERLVAVLLATEDEDLLVRLRGQDIIVTTFADVNDLGHTSPFGRTLQEAVMNVLIRNGFHVKEVRGTKALNVSPRGGEFILSREPEELPAHVTSQLILTGTISETPTTLIVNVRIMDFKSRVALNAASMEIVKTPLIMGLLRGEGEVEPLVLDRVNP